MINCLEGVCQKNKIIPNLISSAVGLQYKRVRSNKTLTVSVCEQTPYKVSLMKVVTVGPLEDWLSFRLQQDEEEEAHSCLFWRAPVAYMGKLYVAAWIWTLFCSCM